MYFRDPEPTAERILWDAVAGLERGTSGAGAAMDAGALANIQL